MNSLDMIWSDFHFIRPLWFLAVLPVGWVLYRLSRQTLGQRGWRGVIDEALMPHVLVGETIQTRSWPFWALTAAGLIAITALAGPAWEKLPQPLFRNESALVIALDLSRSMDATDLNPSRLARARFKIADLLKHRQDGQTALLVFASDAYSVTPLTDDTATIQSQLQVLTTDLMPQQGSRADRAIQKAVDLLRQAGAPRGDILLITDSVDPERDGKTAKEAQDQAYRVHILGIGTAQGAPIPTSDGAFLSDAAGNIVMPALQETDLVRVANAGGGIYEHYTANDADVNHLMIQFDVTTKGNETITDTELKAEQWREEGPWLLLILIPLAALAFRKGYLLVMIMSLTALTGMTCVPESHAADDLWLRPDQQGQALLENGDAKQAAEKFEDSGWKGAARYRAGDFQGALESWQGREDVEDLYNQGNALAQLGQYQEALEAYKRALQKAPDHADAQYNYDLVKNGLEKQEQEQEQQKGDQQKKSEDGGGSEDKQGEESSSDKSSSSDGNQSSQGQGNTDEKQSGQQESDDKTSGSKDSITEQGNQDAQQQEQANEDQGEDMKQGEEGQSEAKHDETEQAAEAALRAIADDPGGLLRRKFIYQYQQMQQEHRSEEQEW